MRNGIHALLLAAIVTFSLLLAMPSSAGDWQLRDIGVGLIVQDENYAKRLTIVERGSQWDAKALYENGAQAGKYRGNQLFAAWIQGPPTSEYLDRNGMPIWSYKYRFTYPDGNTYEGTTSSFYPPGFAYTNITTGKYEAGNWTIDWYIVHRETKEARLVGTTTFSTTYGK